MEMFFLCSRNQSCCKWCKSDLAHVVSGVLQGMAFGPLLFSFHISDISSGIESEIRLFDVSFLQLVTDIYHSTAA